MALVSMKEMLQDARDRKYGIGAFNIFNIESMEAVIEAAEEQKSPTILAFAEVMGDKISIEHVSTIGRQLAQEASVPVAFHLDHGQSYEYVLKAVRNGFSSVMIDASMKSFEDNVAISKKVVEACKPLGITVEAELGHVGEGCTYGQDDDDSFKTVPEEVEKFVELTDVDALAVSIGNAHGLYKKAPVIDHELLKNLESVSKVPLVLHGGSGISDDDFRKTVKEGICKINIFTEMSQQAIANIKDFLDKGDYKWVLDFSFAIKEGMKKVAKKRMEVFDSVGKA
jgi:fructose-bisphosphate aldolase class II